MTIYFVIFEKTTFTTDFFVYHSIFERLNICYTKAANPKGWEGKTKKEEKDLKLPKIKKALALVLCLSMAAATTVSAFGESGSDTQTTPFIQKMDQRFREPEMNYKPAARWWLAEGSHTDETLRESIQEMYDYGYGAVEFVTLDESAYLDDARYAWGSEEWIHDSQLIVEECNRLGMGVSFTSGTHWSTANLVNINPDEEKASQELGYKTVELSPGEHFSGDLPTPQLTKNATKMRLVKVIAAKKSGNEASGATVSLDKESILDLTASAVQAEDGSWQMEYTAPSDGAYILFAFWQYGTSETYKPAMTGEAYTINYFSREGADALIDYWDEHVLTDDLQKLIQENGKVSMYMDSLELQPRGSDTTGNLWCADYLDEFQARRGYDVSEFLPVLILQSESPWSLKDEYRFTLEGDEELCDKVRADLYQTNTELYMEECLDVLTEWMHGFGMTLRAENSYGAKLEISQPIKSLDYVETESFEFNSEIDSFRSQSGAAHLYNKVYSSETGAYHGENYYRNNNHYRQLFYTQFASGIQKTVVHGYSSEYGPEQHCSWPGYEGMQEIFPERFNKRQPASADFAAMNDHVARIQKALMQGTVQMDLGVLRTDYFLNNAQWLWAPTEFSENNLRSNRAYYWQDMTLQNAGYTYDYFSPYLLQDPEISCSDGLVQADGVGYQALLVYQEEMPYESAQVLYQWAQNGLPVVLVEGPTTEQVRTLGVKVNQSGALGTPGNDGKDEELAALMAQMKQLDTVATVQTQQEAYGALLELGVRPRAEYTQSNQNLLSVLRKDSDASYLYVYNYQYEETQNYVGQISLDGVYKPYLLNTWTGETDEIVQYSVEDGRTILNIDLKPGDMMLFALDPSGQDEKTVVARSENVSGISVQDGQQIALVSQSGTAKLTYSDGSTFETEVAAPEDIALNDWSLTVESWEPGDKVFRTEDRGLGYTTTEVTYQTNRVSIDVGKTELKPWKDIDEVGPEVSGIGLYSTTFVLPETWSKQDSGLIFNAESFCGGTAALFVNGQQVPINMDSGSMDISDYVAAGTNELQVRVASSLRNQMIVQGYDRYWNALGYAHEVVPDSYGMTGQTALLTYSKVPVIASQADKTILSKVIAYAEAQYAAPSFETVIEDVQKTFTASLESARAVHANIAATQEEVDNGWKTLMTEIHKLGFVQGDKTTLNQLIEIADTFSAQIDNYTPVTAQPFTQALLSAKTVLEDGNAMQGDVSKAESALLNAMMNLRYKADRSVLTSVLAEASRIETAAYTVQSVTAFSAVYDEAITVNNNQDATQTEVNDAAQKLRNAINGLVGVTAKTTGVEREGDANLTGGRGNAKTGENSPIAIALSLCMLAGAGFILSKKRK